MKYFFLTSHLPIILSCRIATQLQDDYKARHPFENAVKVEFQKYTPTNEEFHSFFKKCHPNVTATELWYNDLNGYINLRDAYSKTEVLTSTSTSDFPYPHSIHDYNRLDDFTGDPLDIRLPFNATIVASYRPSLHSPDNILKRLSKYGFINGSEIITCPYDEDRSFLHCNYQNKESVKAVTIAESIIPGYLVGNDSAFCSNVRENVEIMQNFFNEYRRFMVYVNVTFDGLPSDAVHAEITSFLKEFGEIDMVESDYVPRHKHCIFRVKFRYPISVYRLFYERTMFGRVCKTLPKSGVEIKLLIPQGVLSLLLKHLFTLELNGVVLERDEDVSTFCSELLDSAGCNPGIISGVYVPNDKRMFIKLLHPWYVKDVSERLALYLDSERGNDTKSEYRFLSVVEKNAFWKNFRKLAELKSRDVVL